MEALRNCRVVAVSEIIMTCTKTYTHCCSHRPDKSFMCDGFSMKSASAEICLHLARRMPPGSGERERLVDKGIEQSNIANERVTASNGMIKHLLAYEGNKEIQIGLIELKRGHYCRTVIHLQEQCTSYQWPIRRFNNNKKLHENFDNRDLYSKQIHC